MFSRDNTSVFWSWRCDKQYLADGLSKDQTDVKGHVSSNSIAVDLMSHTNSSIQQDIYLVLAFMESRIL